MAGVPFVGIQNQGSTCYLNSVIQALFHLPYFRNRVYRIKALQLHPLTKELRNIFALLELRCADITTLELTRAFGWDAYEASFQHDVHELVQQLFDCMETTLKGSSNASLINDLFGGQLAFRSRTTDGSNYVADRLQNFYDVELVVKDKQNITESLDELGTPETIEGVSVELTPGAKPTVHTIERMQRFVQLPPILLIHPNRAAFNLETGEPITLDNRWEFSLNLDLAAYMVSPDDLHLDAESTERRRRGGDDGGGKAPATQKDDDLDAEADAVTLPRKLGTSYRLRAILTHAGNTNIGHYYTYIRFDDQWLRFNDDLVERATAEEVQRSAFGEHTAGGEGGHNYFRRERASLLVYINTDCEAQILHEVPAPPELLAEVQLQQDAARVRRSVADLQVPDPDDAEERPVEVVEQGFRIGYILCEEAPLYLEECYGAASREMRVAVLPNGPPATVAEVRAAIASQLNLEPTRLRLLYTGLEVGRGVKIWPASLTSAPLPEHTFIVQVYPTPLPDEVMEKDGFFALVRYVALDGVLQNGVDVVHNRAALSQTLTSIAQRHGVARSAVHVCLYRPFSVTPLTSLEDITDGTILMLAPTDMTSAELEEVIEGKRFAPTHVTQVDRISTQAHSEYYVASVSTMLPYTHMQRHIYRWLRCHKPRECPPSSEYVALHHGRHVSTSPYIVPDVPVDFLPKQQLFFDDGQELSIGRLMARMSSVYTLFFSLLPAPLSQLNLQRPVRLNLGWNMQPYVYLPRDTQRMTLDALIALTLQQLGPHMSTELVTRCRTCAQEDEGASTTRRPLRLLKTVDSRIIDEVASGAQEVDFGDAVSYELDPLTPQPQGYKLVNVLFCRRRSGEEFFGMPTNVCVSETEHETGSMLLLRIAKKLKVPDAETATRKWIVSVRSTTSAAVRTAGKSDVLAKLVAELKSDSYCLLVDRPEVVALDGFDGARRDQAIVIRSTSTGDLANHGVPQGCAENPEGPTQPTEHGGPACDMANSFT